MKLWILYMLTSAAYAMSIMFLVTSGSWFIVSLATSAIKAETKNCDKTYKIERFVSGDWFCEEKPKE